MKYIILLFTALNFGALYAQDNCTDFHLGYFEYTVNGERYILYRTETHQIEYGLEENDWVIMSVDWTSDCSYSMVFINTSLPDIEGVFIGKKLDSHIVNSDESGYQFIAEVKEFDYKTRGEISTLTSELSSSQKKKIKRALKKNL